MRHSLAALFALIAWIAVIGQMVMQLQHSTLATAETLIRYFSYFTVLTNTMVAIYLTGRALQAKWSFRPGLLTALTAYIFIVGSVYQVMLRHLYHPVGWERVFDELLHSVNPIVMLGFWFRYEDKRSVSYRQIPRWLVYPLVYLAYTLLRGAFTRYYPYPFVDAGKIGMSATLVNSVLLIGFFSGVCALLIFLGRRLSAPAAVAD